VDQEVAEVHQEVLVVHHVVVVEEDSIKQY
jgi:hypothetical protein